MEVTTNTVGWQSSGGYNKHGRVAVKWRLQQTRSRGSQVEVTTNTVGWQSSGGYNKHGRVAVKWRLQQTRSGGSQVDVTTNTVGWQSCGGYNKHGRVAVKWRLQQTRSRGNQVEVTTNTVAWQSSGGYNKRRCSRSFRHLRPRLSRCCHHQSVQRRRHAELTAPVPSRQQQPAAIRGVVTLWAKRYNSDPES